MDINLLTCMEMGETGFISNLVRDIVYLRVLVGRSCVRKVFIFAETRYSVRGTSNARGVVSKVKAAGETIQSYTKCVTSDIEIGKKEIKGAELNRLLTGTVVSKNGRITHMQNGDICDIHTKNDGIIPGLISVASGYQIHYKGGARDRVVSLDSSLYS